MPRSSLCFRMLEIDNRNLVTQTLEAHRESLPCTAMGFGLNRNNAEYGRSSAGSATQEER